MIIAFIGMIYSVFMIFIPEFVLLDDLISNASVYIDAIVDLLVKVNFIIPLPDIFMILTADLMVRVLMTFVFSGNWVIKRIFDVIP